MSSTPDQVLPERLPQQGELVQVRSRRWLVEEVVPRDDSRPVSARPSRLRRRRRPGPDARGLLGLRARPPHPRGGGLGATSPSKGFDPPRQFAAFLHTLRWNCVTATDPNLFQAPFRAGIKIDAYQMEPLRKALRLPRVNLFIADDTGLGKTIEAGLIARELLLRKKAKTIVVAAPPSVLEQWKAELEERFGLVFEILDRAYLDPDAARARLRREPVAHAQPLPRLAQPADRPDLRRPAARVARAAAAGQPPDPRRGAPRRALERRPLRHRDEVHPRDPRPLRPLRAPPVPLRHPAQRPLQQLLHAARAPRPVPLHPRRQGPRQEGARRRDGAPAQGGHPRGPGRLPRSGSWSGSSSTDLPEDAPELVLSRLLDEYRTAREERFARTHEARTGRRGPAGRRAPAATALLDRGLRPQPEGPPRRRSSASGRRPGSSRERHCEPTQRSSSRHAPDADDERAEWTAEELEAEEDGADRGRSPQPPRPALARDAERGGSVARGAGAARPDAGDRRARRATSPTPRLRRLRRLDPREPVPRPARRSGSSPAATPPTWNDRRVLIFTENREGTKRYLKDDARAGDRGHRPRRRAHRGHRRPHQRRAAQGDPAPLQHRPGEGPAAHPARHRRRARGPQLPGPLRRPLPLRPALEPGPHRAAQRPHRPQAPAGAGGPLPLLRAPAAGRGPRARGPGREDRDDQARSSAASRRSSTTTSSVGSARASATATPSSWRARSRTRTSTPRRSASPRRSSRRRASARRT